ncbi:Pr6Pr family membrane protein [Demequina sp. NBRC 110057]|uniref:Pr6Pr family membrane protein n=1 Tax=Demequina sp. NBRC 110057 TaxID=1570346 RepID=UPI000A078148|nr:Pr6Pr family membrane protein [Demequina sp. NBRC 110057]
MTTTVRAWRVAMPLATAIAIASLVIDGVSHGDFVFWDFFGYFTIQSNIIGIAALLIALPFTGRERPSWVEWVRVSAATYMVIVVVFFWWLLFPTMEGGPSWEDLVLHLASGIVLVADWLVEGPRRRLPMRHLGLCMIYPAVWLTVVLVRGATDGWVPYFFLDPDDGYGPVATMIAVIVAAGLGICAALIGLASWRVATPSHDVSGAVD